MRKRILSAVLAGALSVTVLAGSIISAGAIKKDDDSYDPGNVEANTYMFAMPGGWESDYWKQNENRAGIYWWTGPDVPKDNFTHEWPGYVVNRVTTEENVKNLYSTAVPKETTMIIFNNHINGGMPSEPDFDKNKFDAAKQIVDTPSQYQIIGFDDYQSKDLWMYVWDKFAEQFDYTPVKWDTSTKDITKAEKAMMKGMFAPASKMKDEEKRLYEENMGEDLPEMPVYVAIEEGELDPEDFEIAEFGTYSKNFYIEMEQGDGIAQMFDKMVYVCNMDPNSMKISTTIVPEGMPTFSGDFFFYYGNGEYGTWPTKELMLEKVGITFDADGKPVAPEGYLIDDYGNVAKIGPGTDGKEAKLMVYGNFTGLYYKNKKPPEIPTDPNPTTAPATSATTIPDPGKDATSASSAKSNTSGTTTTNSANGAVATGDFSFAAVIFVVVAGAIGAVYFTRKKYNR